MDKKRRTDDPRGNEPIAWLIDVDSGTTFALAGREEFRVGRMDRSTGIHPDVDLTTIDPERSTSRRHACIRRGPSGEFSVVDEKGTMNGTYLNGLRLAAGKPYPMEFGDFIVFGLIGFRFERQPGARTRPVRIETRGVPVQPEGGDEQSDVPPSPSAGLRPGQKAASRVRFAFGLNENVEVGDRLFHTQTEDLGWEREEVLSVVYSAGTILFTRTMPYSFFWERHGARFMPAEMVRFQHRGIVAGLRRGRLDDRLTGI